MLEVPFERASFVFSLVAMLNTTDGGKKRGVHHKRKMLWGDKPKGSSTPPCLNDAGRCTRRREMTSLENEDRN